MKKCLLLVIAVLCLVFNGIAMQISGIANALVTQVLKEQPQKKIVIHTAQGELKERKDPWKEKAIGVAELIVAAGCGYTAKRTFGTAMRLVRDLGGYCLGKYTNLPHDLGKRILPTLGFIVSVAGGSYCGYDGLKRLRS